MTTQLTIGQMNPPKFGAWLGMQRRMIELSQAELGQKLGVTRQTISTWENGTQQPAFSIQQIKTLCDLFGCDAREFPNP
ncbi:MAG: helix-turn-helix transcriptional regulator [Drouetiella hepatica Uher 2000/2452]|jgi:DNA-binding XRE family transcriptional regulator|uniref:Helix-turn-helix transcriptional regulator n=1 Tax=Drouetiella hepatica Uher 2000/2452 TaxID=904376 RepID=A0A951QEB0_9CYAN|nr:helix-turn-helix transcriptional regulator [Drouetiella hepatica Uher 2000/2452]